MSKRSDANLEHMAMKPYDLIGEVLIVFIFLAIIITALAIIFGSPDYPPVRGEDVAKRQPIAYLRTSAVFLAGESDLQTYGPPYTPDSAHAQTVLGIAPANWFGVTIPINPAEDFVIKPLERVSVLNKDIANALRTYDDAAPDQRQAWLKAYLAALDKAAVVNGEAQIPIGEYGPVAMLMDGMFQLGRAGLLEGALESGTRLPYTLDFTRSLLFFQGDVAEGVANKLDMLGEQWGISHETGAYPGAWWLLPYTFLYQIPPMSNSSNADLQVGVIMVALFFILFFTPFIPILNRLPYWLGAYKIIWRDWYQREKATHESNERARQQPNTMGGDGAAS
jgi:hypothetical protein